MRLALSKQFAKVPEGKGVRFERRMHSNGITVFVDREIRTTVSGCSHHLVNMFDNFQRNYGVETPAAKGSPAPLA